MSRPSLPTICGILIAMFGIYSVIDSHWLHTDFSRNFAGTWHQCAIISDGTPVTVRCLEGTVTLDFRSGK